MSACPRSARVARAGSDACSSAPAATYLKRCASAAGTGSAETASGNVSSAPATGSPTLTTNPPLADETSTKRPCAGAPGHWISDRDSETARAGTIASLAAGTSVDANSGASQAARSADASAGSAACAPAAVASRSAAAALEQAFVIRPE